MCSRVADLTLRDCLPAFLLAPPARLTACLPACSPHTHTHTQTHTHTHTHTQTHTHTHTQHDPLRYVSDMLAWVHQALASERELLASLFLAAALEARILCEKSVL